MQIIKIEQPNEKQNWFDQFNPEHDTWLVPDLVSKWQLQERCLQRRSVMEELAIMRVGEFWRLLAKQHLPTWQVVSREVMLAHVRQWLAEHSEAWVKVPGVAQSVMDYLEQLFHLLVHEDSDDLLDEWFSKNRSSVLRWRRWYELCRWLWQKLSYSQIVVAQWLPSLLLERVGNFPNLLWPRRLFVDLGSQLTLPEARLFLQLQKKISMVVLQPRPRWLANYVQYLHAYSMFDDKTLNTKDLAHPKLVNSDLSSNFICKRFASALAEVKDAVHTVRVWLESGVKASQIVVCAPDIESYWPMLSSYFAAEGIAVNKAVSTRLHSFSEISHWLSTLRLQAQHLNSADLENHLFSTEQTPSIDYSRFRILFSSLYSSEDLHRCSELKELTSKFVEPQRLLSRDQFLDWALQFWPAHTMDSQRGERLQILLHSFLQDMPSTARFQIDYWLEYLQALCAKKEVEVSPENATGIWCENVHSIEHLQVSHGIFLNLSASQLRHLQTHNLTVDEGQRLLNDLGFYVVAADRREKEFIVRWLAERSWQELILSFAETDFSGQVQSPSPLWYAWVLNQESSQTEKLVTLSPSPTRRDELQALDPIEYARAHSWTESRIEQFTKGIDYDLGLCQRPKLTLKIPLRLSASALESYAECPFVYAAGRVLQLNSDPSLDLDIDAMSKGRILHALFKALTLNETQLLHNSWSDSELEQILEQVIKDEKIDLPEQAVWRAQRNYYIRLAERFVQFEKTWRQQFPHTQTLLREQDFTVGWDTTCAKLIAAEGTNVILRGRIDRVDGDGHGRYVVLDYKSSQYDLKNIPSWLESDAFQMAIYSQVIELGYATCPSGLVEAANYFIAKTMTRERGYFLREHNGDLFMLPSTRSNAGVSRSQRDEFLGEINQRINERILSIKQGKFPTEPKKPETQCGVCDWRQLCRAPHLI